MKATTPPPSPAAVLEALERGVLAALVDASRLRRRLDDIRGAV